MPDVVSSLPRPETVHPPAIPIRELLPWVLFGSALLMLISFVAVADSHVVHEFFHDGRHLMAFPCH